VIWSDELGVLVLRVCFVRYAAVRVLYCKWCEGAAWIHTELCGRPVALQLLVKAHSHSTPCRVPADRPQLYALR